MVVVPSGGYRQLGGFYPNIFPAATIRN